MMQQYLEMKSKNPDSILFFRLGDFYEMFLDDAKLAAKELDLTLTTRDRAKDKEDQVPMCGVPYHSSEAYIARLVARGYKVAVCEQMEDPALAKGLVKRDIIRVVTPGTVTESSMLDESRNNYFASIYGDEVGYGLAFCDVSTGAFSATRAVGDQALERAINELGRYSPAELLLGGSAVGNSVLEELLSGSLACCHAAGTEEEYSGARDALISQLDEMPERLTQDDCQNVVYAAGALLVHLRAAQRTDLGHIHTLDFYVSGRFMELDLAARRNLELTETMRAKEKKGTLLWVLDKTKTAMGGRMLRTWVERPLLNAGAITRRLNAVEELARFTLLREELIECLRGMTDLERIMGRLIAGTANCRDLVSLSAGLACLPDICARMTQCHAPLLTGLAAQIDDMMDLKSLIDRAIVDDPPFSVREGGMIRPGFDAEIDRLHEIMSGGKGSLTAIETQEKEKTGIPKLKIGYNRVFGYYIELPKAYTSQAPDYYIRKQTLANCERYITQELKELENTILTAKDRVTGLEYDCFRRVCATLTDASDRIRRTGSAVAELDVLCTFAAVAVRQNYCKPEINLSGRIVIREGRHPVVEQMLKGSLFVPNDTVLGAEDNQVSIITGPNMAGKSTYMRQVALIVLMAQIGSFVPAKSAEIGIVDRIFTRIGASDDLAAGQSTFMVEMSEVADILKNATPRSLLILDEIGRGTSTYDGMAIARAVLEYAADPKKLGAKTLFATHYHELTVLEDELSGVKNFNIAVKKRQGDMIFLRRIVPGAADQSYGVEVARLAGLPDKVVARAQELLRELEEQGAPTRPAPAPQPEDDQISLQTLSDSALRDRLSKITVETLTPIEAMNILYELKQML
jgi:DNA mismatch repair protein MutS